MHPVSWKSHKKNREDRSLPDREPGSRIYEHIFELCVRNNCTMGGVCSSYWVWKASCAHGKRLNPINQQEVWRHSHAQLSQWDTVARLLGLSPPLHLMSTWHETLRKTAWWPPVTVYTVTTWSGKVTQTFLPEKQNLIFAQNPCMNIHRGITCNGSKMEKKLTCLSMIECLNKLRDVCRMEYSSAINDIALWYI